MIDVQQLKIQQGDFVLDDFSLHVESGQYAVLMGRSGCGKTTLLEAICGLRPIQAGHIRLSNRDVTLLKPAERGVGYVPQDRALFPTMRVRAQLAFSLVTRRLATPLIAGRVNELADLMSIDHLLDRMPASLSGGEAQRVALGRALASKPTVLLLDEPLSALDEELHTEMCELLKKIHQQTSVTVLHITHSQQEAQKLGDCRFRLEDGKLHTQ
ncbi:MAG: Maltose/maltodextrin import ATP-binding protein MalK [Verrucomicrobia subdivision 3 bacterium]|nr:Maltose/maltodextrin import ATP-binding protein MalK [Limisphaerales bacterium]MCS1416171.1 Maltose/maltodextrin import ATP-binding protein MalK [Limisphaerales bacterium]